MKTILVTSGTGQVLLGSHLVDRLLDEGNKVICVDNFILGSMDNLKNAIKSKSFKIYNKDILDLASLDEIFKENFLKLFIILLRILTLKRVLNLQTVILILHL